MRRACLTLLVSFLTLPATAQNASQSRPRRIALPEECQHPFRQLYVYGGGRRLGLRAERDFCHIDVASGRVKTYATKGHIRAVAPTPRGSLVAVTLQNDNRIIVIDDDDRVLVDQDLGAAAGFSLSWTKDESRLIVQREIDEWESDLIAVITVRNKQIRQVNFKATESAWFDEKTNTVRAEYVAGKAGKSSRVAVYDLEGKLLRTETHFSPSAREQHDNSGIQSATGKYSFRPKHEVGEGDTLVREGAKGRVVLRIREGRTGGALLWDNPEWNPVNDDLILGFYLPGDESRAGTGAIDVFSLSQGKAVKTFSLGGKDTPAYGWSGDGKQVILCDVACLFYNVP